MGCSSSVYSYHISQEFGSNVFIEMWPAAGFSAYCTSKKTAVKELNIMRKSEPNSKFRLGRYLAVLDGRTVIGVTGTLEILDL